MRLQYSQATDIRAGVALAAIAVALHLDISKLDFRESTAWMVETELVCAAFWHALFVLVPSSTILTDTSVSWG